jgi:arylsulfatase A-like enzyme
MKKAKNIILLMTDQHRIDYVSYAGSKKVDTPNIDRIAESVGFTNCQSVNPVCTPARTALITGKYTHQIGTLAMSGDLSLQHPTFMRALQKAGYHTSGIGKFHFLQTWEWGVPRGQGVHLVSLREKIKEYGYDYVWETSGKQLAVKNYCDYCEYLEQKGLLETYRDFVQASGPNTPFPDVWPEDEANPWPLSEEDYIDVVTADKIIDRIEARPEDKPFFIFGSFCSPHKPFDPPQRYLDMVPYEEIDDFIPGEKALSDIDKLRLYKKRRAYIAMIRLIDDQIGRILAALEQNGLLEDTVILFTADHGEMLGDHFRIQKSLPFRASATVPTAIRHPEYLHRKVSEAPVELTDLTATILDIAGLDPQEALSKRWPAFHNIVPSRSIMPIVTGEKDRIRDFTFTECSGKWQMIQTERWKYVRFLDYSDPDQVVELFYDLRNDYAETVNRIDDPSYKPVIEWCRKRRDFVMDRTPPAQTVWAPLIESH